MIRLVIRSEDAGMACNVGGSVLTKFHTVDIEHEQLERLLTPNGTYAQAQLLGAQVIGVTGTEGKIGGGA